MSKNKAVSKETKININELRSLVEETCLSCYGIASLASADQLKKMKVKGNIEQGISIDKKGSSFSATLYVNVAYGIKVSEALRECQQKILYVVSRKCPTFNVVNIYAIANAH